MQLKQFIHVEVNRIGKVGKLKGQDLGVRQTHDCCAHCLCEYALVAEGRVAKMGIPIKIVIGRGFPPSPPMDPGPFPERSQAWWFAPELGLKDITVTQ